jgi:hypothetical protein
MADEQLASFVAQIAKARRKVIKAVAGLGGSQETFTPAAGEWSLPGILEHPFLAEQVGVNRTWHAAQAAQQGDPAWSGDLPHRGQDIDKVIEETWAVSSRGPVSIRATEDAPLAAVARLTARSAKRCVGPWQRPVPGPRRWPPKALRQR